MLSNLLNVIGVVFIGFLAFGTACFLLMKSGPKYHMFNPEPKSYEVAPALSGILLDKGKIMANMKIVRTYKWNPNKDAEDDETTTDENGYFSFPSVQKTLALTPLAQHAFYCELTLGRKNGDLVWHASNPGERKYFEEGKYPSHITCDMKSDEITVRTGNSLVVTKCHGDESNI